MKTPASWAPAGNSRRHSATQQPRRASWIGLALATSAALAVPAAATTRLDKLGLGPLELSGNIQTQNLLRHPTAAPDDWQFVQQRNTFRTRVDWDVIQGGYLAGKFKVPGIRKAKFFLLYRFVYDSIYDYTPKTYPKKDFRRSDTSTNPGGLFGPKGDLPALPAKLRSLDGLPQEELDAYKFENSLREVYVDVALRKIPLSLRVGRQQIVWGESDGFRMLDRVNPLDLTWHFHQEVPPPAFGWDDLRRPFWMLKGLYNLGSLGPLSQSFFEFYWNPGDWHPVKQAFLPRPWGLQIYDPFTNRGDGAFRYAPCTTSDVAINPDTGFGMCTRLLGGGDLGALRTLGPALASSNPDVRQPALLQLNRMEGTRFFQQGDYDSWDPLDNSQVGARFHAVTPQGIEFTLNYLWQRWAGDDGTNSAQLRALPVFNRAHVSEDPNAISAATLLDAGIFPAEYYTPYVNTAGFSMNYSDEQFTQTVYRMETILDFGIPFYDRGVRTVVDDLLPGVREKNMWKGMIGFDRFQWIRFLNKKSTFFITGQFFWHYLMNNPSCPDVVGRNFGKNGESCLTGGADLPSVARPKDISFRDKVRDWESLFILSTLTFYKGGAIVPAAGLAVDYVNHWSTLAFWSLDYLIRPNLAVNLTQRFFLNPTGEDGPIFGTWGLTDLNRGRSETGLRVTFMY